ncbi:alpha/beta hydrolase [Bradyrhizobium sp. U87765 SZCCT0131]|uniref:alpha/beta fold hydrolase n=1 Tax=unclassified Bradyrhizobium TaxID=2631580 RepID=UPI001BAC6FF2|nr:MULTISPECIES: alpha/beta hydrolase [unclassified Bradyrhizobium]MBR1223147.1 alpha/beta hydrolase [Bradyrhizobium sp. U87765 SZCCT0131]MBR1265725.1 alpha/beta hydrolase [Bradyrhizobium sp. U87765 SZCCT0134]MBR1309304.1 alpha/beta hydrolase [Bradyrhizobium sp. U87765 SZCCT0110]MBR1324132.1 alpha/beta hydrolase [Bradyrhizobium sp. U87765 SZCCT0109]MBR1352565.1 alpha/beta hydrolase [Bradyrhizobium sp. U87765 SZCCT0048]
MKIPSIVLSLLLLALPARADEQARAAPAAREPYGIGLEGFAYPYPVQMLPLVNEGEQVRMAYMDVAPTAPNGRTVLLLHGRNFPSSYWAPVIRMLSTAGYRVLVPDQIGFGKSSKPTFDLHFDQLARNTIALLDHLQLHDVDVVAHSLGGMLGVRIARAYPDRVHRLALVAPIGLEDYRLYVPPTPTEKILEAEDKLTADGYRQQLVTNYALTLPPDAITPFIDARFNIKGAADYARWLRAFVSSAQMIYREPVAHEIALITRPTLFVMGENDHNAPGRANAPDALRDKMGHNADLARAFAAQMPNAKIDVIPGVGHLVFLEAESAFNAALLPFLAAP